MAADVGTLTAKLTLDTTAFQKAAGEIEGLANNLAGGIGKTLGGVATAVGATTAAAAAGVASLVKESVQSFAEYEQLVGGVETLFKDSAGIVQEYANAAYKTAGLSANDYMKTVTSFSASLLQSLGGDTAEAAKVADMAIIDMADNANKMGTDMEAIQNAYQGFAKQNYTMLDNLKLGYGGTKAEMERLLMDAEKLTGIKYDISNLSDVYNAIHAIQDELGITGTTAAEASETISGSFGMMKAAWENVLISISGGGQNLTTAIDQLVQSAGTFAQNVVPVIIQALQGVAQLIQQIAPTIAAALPELVVTVAPMILEAAMSIVSTLTAALPELIGSIMESLTAILPQIIVTITELLNTLTGTILPMILMLGATLVMQLATAIVENAPNMSASVMTLITTVITLLTEMLPMLITSGVQIVSYLAQTIADNAQLIMAGIVILLQTVLLSLVENLPTLITAGLTIISGLIDGILNNLPLISQAVVILITTFVTTILEHLPDILAAAIEIGAKIVLGIVMAIPSLIVAVGQMLGIVQDTKDQVTDHSNNMQSAVNTSTMGINSDINGMIENLNQKTAEARSTLSTSNREFTSVQDDMNKKADDLNNTAKDVQRQMTISFGGIRDIVQFARAAMDQGFEEMTESMMRFEEKFRELGAMQAAPTVDPSGVVDACQEIVEAVEDALDALADLASASGGGGGGFGGGHAKGGYVHAGTTYLVGELGPELITPTRSGYVHTAEETASMFGGSGQSINITIAGDVYADERSMRQKMKRAVLGVLQEQVVYG